MVTFVIRRIILMILTMLIVSVAVFAVSEILPLDVARNILGRYATEEQVEIVRHQLGLDRPAHVRYIEWVSGFLTGDFGISTHTGKPVAGLLIRRAKNSAILAGAAWVVIMPLGLLFGIVAGLKAGKLADRAISIIGLITTSTPTFASAVLCILIFSIWLGLLPGTSTLDHENLIWESPSKLVLPILVLVLSDVGYIARMTRASMAETMRSPYIRTAFLKGLPRSTVVLKHALRNALLVPITVIMLHVNWLIGGLVVVESVFGFPGLGRMMLDASLTKDLHVVEAGAMVFTLVSVSTQLLTDIIYTRLNPRIRFT